MHDNLSPALQKFGPGTVFLRLGTEVVASYQPTRRAVAHCQSHDEPWPFRVKYMESRQFPRSPGRWSEIVSSNENSDGTRANRRPGQSWQRI